MNYVLLGADFREVWKVKDGRLVYTGELLPGVFPRYGDGWWIIPPGHVHSNACIHGQHDGTAPCEHFTKAETAIRRLLQK